MGRLPTVHRGDAQPLDHASFFFVVASEIGPGPQSRALRWSIHCMVLYCRLLAEIVKPALVRGLHYQHTFPPVLYSVKMSRPWNRLGHVEQDQAFAPLSSKNKC